jgi:hypothetical protein
MQVCKGAIQGVACEKNVETKRADTQVRPYMNWKRAGTGACPYMW